MSLQQKKVIISLLKNLRKEGDLVYLFFYGSKDISTDLDFFAVFKELPVDCCYQPSQIDVYRESLKTFIEKVYLLYPIATEPLLTGELVFGNKQQILVLKNKILTIKPSSEILKYFHEKIFLIFNYALGFLRLIKENPKEVKLQLNCLQNLSFSCGILNFYLYYQAPNAKVITLNELKKIYPSPLLDKIQTVLRTIKNGQLKNLAEIKKLFKEYVVLLQQKKLLTTKKERLQYK